MYKEVEIDVRWMTNQCDGKGNFVYWGKFTIPHLLFKWCETFCYIYSFFRNHFLQVFLLSIFILKDVNLFLLFIKCSSNSCCQGLYPFFLFQARTLYWNSDFLNRLWIVFKILVRYCYSFLNYYRTFYTFLFIPDKLLLKHMYLAFPYESLFKLMYPIICLFLVKP